MIATHKPVYTKLNLLSGRNYREWSSFVGLFHQSKQANVFHCVNEAMNSTDSGSNTNPVLET